MYTIAATTANTISIGTMRNSRANTESAPFPGRDARASGSLRCPHHTRPARVALISSRRAIYSSILASTNVANRWHTSLFPMGFTANPSIPASSARRRSSS
nr:MAG TPA: hypothetical protein [Caudoviricetes sp.]